MSWFHSHHAAPQGAALVIHGLNLRPEKMLSLVEMLNQWGIDAFNLSLYGHGEPLGKTFEDSPSTGIHAMKQVTHALWLQETRCAYQSVKAHARQHEVPLLLVGFSLGAVLGLELFAWEERLFDKMILLAPPLVIHARGYGVQLLRWFPQVVLKSFAPKDYRVHRGTAVAAYLALFQAIAHVQDLPPAANVPTRLFIHRNDPLVNAKALPLFLTKHQLTHWKLSPLTKGCESACGGAHLILDEGSLGKTAWKHLQHEIQAHWMERRC